MPFELVFLGAQIPFTKNKTEISWFGFDLKTKLMGIGTFLTP